MKENRGYTHLADKKKSRKKIYVNERRQELKKNLDASRVSLSIGIPESKFVENLGGIIRSSNAFLIKEIVLDQAVYNKFSSVGCDQWENIIVTDNIFEYFKKQDYFLVALEQDPKSIKLWDFKFPEKTAIIIGHEVHGNSDEILKACDYIVEIPQYGLVESLNVATATSIAMYEYIRQYKK